MYQQLDFSPVLTRLGLSIPPCPKILIIDEDIVYTTLFEEVSKSRHCEVVCCNGMEEIKGVGREEFHAIIIGSLGDQLSAEGIIEGVSKRFPLSPFIISTEQVGWCEVPVLAVSNTIEIVPKSVGMNQILNCAIDLAQKPCI